MPRASKAPKKPESGGARLARAGKHPILLGVTPEQREILREAAENEGRPVTQFVLFHSLVAAKKNLRKSS